MIGSMGIWFWCKFSSLSHWPLLANMSLFCWSVLHAYCLVFDRRCQQHHHLHCSMRNGRGVFLGDILSTFLAWDHYFQQLLRSWELACKCCNPSMTIKHFHSYLWSTLHILHITIIFCIISTWTAVDWFFFTTIIQWRWCGDHQKLVASMLNCRKENLFKPLYKLADSIHPLSETEYIQPAGPPCIHRLHRFCRQQREAVECHQHSQLPIL